MADAIVKAAANQIGSLLLEEGRALYAVKGKVEYLYRELKMMHAFLRQMDSRNHGEYSEVVNQAISWIRDLAYEAEDIVEMYSNGVTHKRELEEISHTLKWFFCGLICNPCDAAAQHQVGAEIDAIREKLQHVTSQLQCYTIGGSVGVKSSGSSTTVGQQLIEDKAYFNLLEEDPIGLDQATEHLAQKFAHADIISISGMGGLGKSTLAKKVYKKVQDNNEFNRFAWVFISQQFQRAQVWRNIITKLGEDTKDISDHDLPDKLDQLLRMKRCFVVLDDLWSEADWDQLKPAFLRINHEYGSKLLITTRRRELLEHVDPTGYPYELKALSEKQSWDLFVKKIRPQNVLDDTQKKESSEEKELGKDSESAEKKESVKTKELGKDSESAEKKKSVNKKELGKEMVNKCKGLPLAIVALTGILSKKKTIEEWNNVNSSLKSIHQDTNWIGIQMLELSYNDLPHYLRPCFLYLASYPEDYIISVEKLLHLWEAEGFLELRPTITKDTLKNVGMSYLIELAERFLIIVNEKTQSGKIKEFHLHDMIRDMCINKAKEENFLHMVTEGEKSGTILLDNIPIQSEFAMRVERLHRLAVHGLNENDLKFASTNLFKKWNHLRSLVLFDLHRKNHRLASYIIKGAMRAFSSLRVLDIEGYGYFPIFPHLKVGGLKNLRYLNLKGLHWQGLYPNLVPLYIRELRYLISLDLRVSYYFSSPPGILPNLFSNLKRLKHLYLPERFRCVGGCSLNLSNLTRLEILVNFSVNKCRIEDLYKLTNLKKFRINREYFNYSTRRKIKHFLKCCPTLSNAYAKPFLFRMDIAILLREPNSLQRLWGTSVGDPSLCQLWLETSKSIRCPAAILESGFLAKLEYLTLFGIMMAEMDPVQILGNKLPQLKCLCLYYFSNSEVREMVCPERGFPQLTTLVLFFMVCLEKLKVEEGAMPNLIRLCILRCPKLNTEDIFVGERAKEITVIQSEVAAYWTEERGFKERAIREEWKGMGHENTRMNKRRIMADNIEDESVDQRNRAHSVDGSARFGGDTSSDVLNVTRSRSWG